MRTLLDEEQWDVACAVFVSTDRTQHCLLEYVHPGHPGYAQAAVSPVADRVRRLYRLLDAERRRCSSARTRRPRGAHVRSRSPAVHARGLDEQGARGAGFLRFARGSRSSTSCPGVASVRSRASPTTGSGSTAACSADSPIDWAKTPAYTSVVSTGEGVSLNLVGREPNGRSRARTTSESGTKSHRPCSSSRTRRRGGRPSEASSARRRCSRARTSTARRTPSRARPALQPHARAPAGGGRRLAFGGSPAGGHLRHGRAGYRAVEGPEISLADFAGQIPEGVGLHPDPDGAGRRRRRRSAPSARKRSARSKNAFEASGTSSSADGGPRKGRTTLLAGTAANVAASTPESRPPSASRSSSAGRSPPADSGSSPWRSRSRSSPPPVAASGWTWRRFAWSRSVAAQTPRLICVALSTAAPSSPRGQPGRRGAPRRLGAALRGLRAGDRTRGDRSSVPRAHERLSRRGARPHADAADPLRVLDRSAPPLDRLAALALAAGGKPTRSSSPTTPRGSWRASPRGRSGAGRRAPSRAGRRPGPRSRRAPLRPAARARGAARAGRLLG